MRHHDRYGRGSSALLFLFLSGSAAAQSTAGFPPVSGAPAPQAPLRATPAPPPPYYPPAAPPPYPAPSPAPQPGYAPVAPSPQPGYAPQQQQYGPPGGPSQYPYPPPPPQVAPGYPPPQGYGPGPYAPAYPAPGGAEAAPPPVPNPLLDATLRYRQVLGAYQRTNMPEAQNAPKKRIAFLRLADRSRRHHDGLYFRFAGGLGFGHDAMKADRTLPSLNMFSFVSPPLDGSGGGTAAVTEVAIGYTPTAGVALGAGIYTATIPGLTADVGDPRTGSYHYRVSQLAVIGPFVDWYFFPDAGFHAQASPGVGTYVAGAAEPTNQGPQAQAHTAVGLGLMLGVGYEWWIGDEWSLGFLGRFTYGSMSGKDDRGVSWTHSTYAPAVLLSATYN